jgi:UDP-3-O-[3-hydroxymyristoyl] glucosamine N-acyltransferase
MPKIFTTQAIANSIGARVIGKGDIVIRRLSHPADIQGNDNLALAMDIKLLPLLKDGKARAAVVSEKGAAEPSDIGVESLVVVSRPRLALSRLTNLFAEPIAVTVGVHTTAIVEAGAKIGQDVAIGAYSYIATGAVIGDRSVIHPQAYIGPYATIGSEALIYSGVRIGANCVIGDRFICHFNTTIGADGFSFVTPQPGSVEEAKEGGGNVVTSSNHELVRIASIGNVIIGDDVEIGANTSVDRGTIAATRIGNGTKIDNQVQIGHNVSIGDNCLICGRVGIAGSAKIGNRVVLGGATGVADHVTIADDAVAMGMSGVAGNVPARSIVGGIPAMPRDRIMANILNVGRIGHFIKKISSLAERVDQLEASKSLKD